jgi:NADH-quinone oxidoreductase subunit F
MDFIQRNPAVNCLAAAIGTKRMLAIWRHHARGRPRGGFELLEELGAVINQTAMCELARPLQPGAVHHQVHPREYEDHIPPEVLPRWVCSDLFNSRANTRVRQHNTPGTGADRRGPFPGAYDLICRRTLPSVCGRICTRPCESKCRRATVDEAVSICSLKRFVADYAYKNQKQFDQDIVFPKSGKSVAVIGAGTSGLTCAYYLSRIGYEVTCTKANPLPEACWLRHTGVPPALGDIGAGDRPHAALGLQHPPEHRSGPRRFL